MTTTRSNSSSNVICTLFYKRVLYRCRIFKLPWAHLNHFILSTITKQSTNYSVPSPASIRSTSRSTIQRDSRFLVFSSATGWWGNSRLDRRVRTYAVRFKFLLHRHHPTRLLPLQSPHPDRFPRWRQRCGALLIQPWRRLLLIWGRRNRKWFARSGRGFGARVETVQRSAGGGAQRGRLQAGSDDEGQRHLPHAKRSLPLLKRLAWLPARPGRHAGSVRTDSRGAAEGTTTEHGMIVFKTRALTFRSHARTHARTPRCNDKYSPLFQEIRMAIWNNNNQMYVHLETTRSTEAVEWGATGDVWDEETARECAPAWNHAALGSLQWEASASKAKKIRQFD